MYEKDGDYRVGDRVVYREELIEWAILTALMVGSLYYTYKLGYLHGMYGL